MFCIVCEGETKKYKCPKCSAFYCSLPCFKTHKDSIICQQQQELQEQATVATSQRDDLLDNEPTIHDPFSTDDTVPKEQLEMLRNCKSLQDLLYNPHLRNLLHEIDVAPSAWRAMNAAMQEPLFVEFADGCLKVIEPMTEAERKELLLN